VNVPGSAWHINNQGTYDSNMHSHDISSRLIAHIASVCEIDPGLISSETTIESIGFDSLSLPRVLHALEVEFVVCFHEDDVIALLGARTIGAYIELISRAVDRESRLTAVGNAAR
jgi:acyl carrier protein